MNMLSDRVQSIRPSPTLAMIAKAKSMKQQGIAVIDLAGGEPDFPTPQVAIDAAIYAMQNGDTKYTAVEGTAALKEAIIKKLKRENNLDYKPEEVITSTGAKQALCNALLATINPGDEVIIPAAYWVSYPDMVLLAGGAPVIIKGDEQNLFKLTPTQLSQAITKKTKWLILNSPNNPTGAVYTKEELEALAEILRQHPHVWIMSDDIYEHILFDGRTFSTLAMVAPDLKERILTFNGLSKSHAMTGWRIGYAAGDARIIKAMSKIQSQSTSNPSSITQAAATAALNASQEFMIPWKEEYQRRRDDLTAQLSQYPGLKVILPEGAFYLFIRVAGLLGKQTVQGKILETDVDVSEYFLEEAQVATVPGSAFGTSPYIRMSFANAYELLMQAADQIGQAIIKLS